MSETLEREVWDGTSPKNGCLSFFIKKRRYDWVLLKKSEFDALCEAGQFAMGPYEDSFGDGYGEPYNPRAWRQAFGILKDGRAVYCPLG